MYNAESEHLVLGLYSKVGNRMKVRRVETL